MIYGQAIRDDHHVAHYVRPSDTRDDDGRPKGRAFELRGSEPYVSGNWLEYYRRAPTTEARVECICAALRAKNFTVKTSGRLAVVGVARAKQAVARQVRGAILHVKYRPNPDDPSHVGLEVDGGKAYGSAQRNKRVAAALRSIVGADDVHSPPTPRDESAGPEARQNKTQPLKT